MSGRAQPETFYSRPFIRLASKIAAAKGLTMDDLAVQAQIRRGRMTRYERGTVEPWISDVFAVAKALDVSPIWFFGQILAEGKAAGISRSHRLAEEDPDMASLPRTRAFQGRGNVSLAARLDEGQCVPRPTFPIEVRREKPAGFVGEQRIHPGNKWKCASSGARLASQMVRDHLV